MFRANSNRMFFVGVTIFLVAIFCLGFTYFFEGTEPSPAKVSNSKSLIDKPLPKAELLDGNGSKVDEQALRRGKVIVVFVTPDCDACIEESKFLQTVLHKRSDVTFYGLVPFGRHPDTVAAAEKMFPFKVYYDDSNTFVSHMGINRVPVKVFLEDGIIKKGWIGAALTDRSRTSFVDWLDQLP